MALPSMTPQLSGSGGAATSGDVKQTGNTFSFGGINEAQPAISSGAFQVSPTLIIAGIAGLLGVLYILRKK